MNKVFINLLNYVLSMFCFICIYFLHQLLFKSAETTFIIAAFGASAVLVFSNETKDYSFLKISISSVIAAVIGVFFQQLDLVMVFKIALTISSCILFMNLFNSSYPPAGAIAIIPLLSNTEIQHLGYLYALYPTLTGLIIIYSFSKIKIKINTIYNGKQKNN